MKVVALVTLLFSSVFGLPTLPQWVDTENRIVGGSDDEIENVPWQISLQRNGAHSCGGSILNTNTIMSAAHCVDVVTDPAAYRVRAGSTDRTTGGQLMEVTEIHIHPDYSRQTLFYDIAILRLNANLVYGSGVQPVALPPAYLNLPGGTPTQLSGWGTLVFQGPSTNILQTVTKPMVSMESCQASYGQSSVNPDIQICSGEEGRDACQGDSGGALIYEGMAIGIVSWGNGCAWAGYPTVYTRVASFLNYISVFI